MTPQRAASVQRATVRRNQKGKIDGRSNGNHTHAHKEKIRSEQDKIFHDTPVRDTEWKKIPFADAEVPEKELEAAKGRAVDAMGEWGVLVEASRASGIGRFSLYRLMKSDETFRRRMAGAHKNCIERIEREMIRRGQIKGGELAGIYITKHNIKKYREIQRLELTGRGGGPVAYTEAKAELLKRLESLALKSQAVDAVVVGEKPRLIQGGSDAEGPKVKHIEKGKGWKAESKR